MGRKPKFRANDATLIYEGPYQCAGCKQMVCKVSEEQGGVVLDYPEGAIYPNTKWTLHQCAPHLPESEVVPPAEGQSSI